MHTDHDLTRLHESIYAYVNGQATEQQRAEVEQWYENLDAEMGAFETREIELTRSELFRGITEQQNTYGKLAGALKILPRSKSFFNPRLLAVAAIFLVVAGIGAVMYLLNEKRRVEISTGFGKIDTVYLPDRSAVVLNGNSSIRYAKSWKRSTRREVWLEGEGLFFVNHLHSSGPIKDNERFVVHVQNATIEVLGTVFNIRDRRGKTEIVLQQGSIKVWPAGNRKNVTLAPGEMIIVDPQQKSITRTTIKAEEYTAWTRQKLILANPTFKNIIAYLEDNYGKEIVLSAPELADRRIGGTLMIDNLDDALFILSKTLDLEVTAEGDKLFITPR